MGEPLDVCQRATCGWYRNAHRQHEGVPRCPYHYKRLKDGTWPQFQEKEQSNAC